MEKIRQSTQSIGRILFAQCTELIIPATSRGLPPNLAVEEPSESFIFKGTDILIASLLSELGFLSNPVASHVQTAEMGNQSVNSLALISARYTLDALDILSQLAAAHLVAVCQALDLRALHTRFLASLELDFGTLLKQGLHKYIANAESMDVLLGKCWKAFTNQLDSTTSLDSTVRLTRAIVNLQPLIIPAMLPCADALKALIACMERLEECTVGLFERIREQYLKTGNATDLLGRASKRIYNHVRKEVGIPFVGPETLATPACPERSGRGLTMGALNGRVRAAMASGQLYSVVVECIKEVEKADVSKERISAKL